MVLNALKPALTLDEIKTLQDSIIEEIKGTYRENSMNQKEYEEIIDIICTEFYRAVRCKR